MEWTDDGIVLGARRHGEANAILELMTRGHGRHLGLVRGGFGPRHRPVLQAGNLVRATWRARLDEHLGYYVVEGIELRASSYMGCACALYGVQHLAALCRLLPERDPHEDVFELLALAVAALALPARAPVSIAVGASLGISASPATEVAPVLAERVAAARIARFELRLLAELGFGLDLAACAVTGATADLVYVSPRSGRAVSRNAGEPWRDKLLALPGFLLDPAIGEPSAAALRDGFALTGYFLARHVLEPRAETLPEARQYFITTVGRSRG